MKESIYTIPINDAFDSECDCPLCYIKNKLENELVEAAVGAAMMEPDHRQNSNDKGFCQKHIKMVYSQQKALPLALVLQTYIQQQNSNIFNFLEKKPTQKGIFKGKATLKDNALVMTEYIDSQLTKCSICDSLNNQMQRYAENTVYMWKEKPEFKDKFNNKAFCLEHFNILVKCAVTGLSDKAFSEFFEIISLNQKDLLSKLYTDITDFVNSFDYRFNGELSDDARFATSEAIKKYIGEDINS